MVIIERRSGILQKRVYVEFREMKQESSKVDVEVDVNAHVSFLG